MNFPGLIWHSFIHNRQNGHVQYSTYTVRAVWVNVGSQQDCRNACHYNIQTPMSSQFLFHPCSLAPRQRPLHPIGMDVSQKRRGTRLGLAGHGLRSDAGVQRESCYCRHQTRSCIYTKLWKVCHWCLGDALFVSTSDDWEVLIRTKQECNHISASLSIQVLAIIWNRSRRI